MFIQQLKLNISITFPLSCIPSDQRKTLTDALSSFRLDLPV